MRLSQGAVAALECFNGAIIHEVRFRPAMLPRIRQLAKDMYAGAEEYQQQARTVIELLNSDRVIPIEVI